MFLKECKYSQLAKKLIRHINDDLKISSEDLDKSDKEQIKTGSFKKNFKWKYGSPFMKREIYTKSVENVFFNKTIFAIF